MCTAAACCHMEVAHTWLGPGRSQRPKQVTWRSCLNACGFYLVTTPCAASIASRGIPSSVGHVGTTQRWTAAALLAFSGVILKDTGEGNSSQRAEFQAVQVALCFIWKKKWQDIQLFTDSWAPANGSIGWTVRDWKRLQLENWWESCVRQMCTHLSQWKDIEILYPV